MNGYISAEYVEYIQRMYCCICIRYLFNDGKRVSFCVVRLRPPVEGYRQRRHHLVEERLVGVLEGLVEEPLVVALEGLEKLRLVEVLELLVGQMVMGQTVVVGQTVGRPLVVADH